MQWADAGGDVPPPLTVARVLLDWHLDPLLAAGLLVGAGLYVWGVVRLARRGDRWSGGRTAAFVLGLGVVAVATMSGLAAYDDVLFSAHMAQHMMLTMLAPVPLALGAPVTLALRAASVPGRRRLLTLLHSRVSRVVGSPVLGTFLFVVSPFALYFSSIYEATLRSSSLHALLHLHFLAVGCLFLWPLLGLDPLPNRLSPPLRLVLVFVTLPFHAFLGVTIMASGLLAGEWYTSIPRAWGASPLSDQHTGGGLLWVSGDLLGLLLVGVVAFQWMRADERSAVQVDRRLDREEAALAAYNAKLAEKSLRST